MAGELLSKDVIHQSSGTKGLHVQIKKSFVHLILYFSSLRRPFLSPGSSPVHSRFHLWEEIYFPIYLGAGFHEWKTVFQLFSSVQFSHASIAEVFFKIFSS